MAHNKSADGKSMKRLKSKGSTAVEMAMLMPFIVVLMLSIVGVSSLCVKGYLISLSAFRIARAEKVFQGSVATKGELYAMLTPDFSGGIDVDWFGTDGSKRVENWNFGRLRVEVSPGGLPAIVSADRLTRYAPVAPALPKNLTDVALGGGDTPSPYCRDGTGYYVCGYDY
ncbi:MAG: pilus assembly protein [Deltaproteobacteria bacterium]|jgi:hypothetical protein|nr:pilus assembly protein [Deltaproteobacteria bacterium]